MHTENTYFRATNGLKNHFTKISFSCFEYVAPFTHTIISTREQKMQFTFFFF